MKLNTLRFFTIALLKMLQIALQYTLPRMEQATNEVSEDLPLFIN